MGDFLISDEISVIDTKIRNIKLRKNQIVDNLLFAIGDDFGITEKGILYARESYIRNGLFQSLVCKDMVVDQNATIKKNLTVKEDLYVKGNLKVEGAIICDHNIQAKNIKATHTLYCDDLCVSRDANLYISTSSEESDVSPYEGMKFYDIYEKLFATHGSGEEILNSGNGNSNLNPDDILYDGGGN